MESSRSRRIQKPIVVYVLTILIVVGYGIVPFLTAFPILGRRFIFGALPFNGSITLLYGSDGEASFLLVFISLFLCVFSVVSSIWAFYGYNEGRIAALAFVTTNFLWWTFLVIIAIVNTQPRDPVIFSLFGSLIVPPIWLGFIWWHFTQAHVVAYYNQESQD